MLVDILIDGLIKGSVYALLAIGFSLVLGVARIINIAHTALYMTSAYLIYVGTKIMGLPAILCMVTAIFLTILLGLLIYNFFIRPIQEHEAAMLISTIAVGMMLQEVFLMIFGGHYLGVEPLIGGYATIMGVRVTNQHLLALGLAIIVLVSVRFFLMKTRTGLAIRSTANDREVANLMGMNVTGVAFVTMAVSVGLASIAGAIVVPLVTVEPTMWMHPLIMMLAIVVLGGLGSIEGSFVGAYILGFAESLVVFLLPNGSFLKDAVALTIMILVLLVRPEGLFGVSFEEER
ncbi:amino acid/amide ABC transporter membrane protein 1, HAAT family [Desulfatibacillum alkenivorans DSM 16219]|jgi:branched-chain amino acid transport system permease protein|uniref:Amino acid/amide ABC transporter membrane protein 1, HAAT family n=1 Tax=Desulfatibacillum alkenivorans DSM 16219 TaxID=1121393 RepID=A0A1M6Q450_9BACT|nr:branched-chain amino acid ABC transporter permease [Desulfatibacillum alkenivorans]SHK14897.1 amino acid/amide ABC transporter membrane protein 1, HAAT family [Desulfatibacillum alkenivorans DSM 16219]